MIGIGIMFWNPSRSITTQGDGRPELTTRQERSDRHAFPACERGQVERPARRPGIIPAGVTVIRGLLLLLAVIAPLEAEPPNLLGCVINELTDRSAHVLCGISAPNANYNFRVWWDTDNTSLDIATAIGGGASSTITRRNSRIANLPPDSDIWLGPVVTDTDGTTWTSIPTCSTTCTNCDSSDDPIFGDNGSGGSGFDCDSVGDYWSFHTPPLATCDGGPPCKPDPPVHSGATSAPAVTGTTRTVNASCANLQALLDAAASDARGGGAVEEIVIPPDRICRPENESTGAQNHYDLPHACPGKVILRSGADPKLLPPAGTQTDPSYLPYTGKIEINLDMSKQNNGMLRFEAVGGNSGCWYLENISVSPPDLSDLTPIILSITNINTTTDVFTASSAIPPGIANGDFVAVDLESTGVRNGHGTFVICDISGSTFTIDDGSCSGARRNLLGTYSSGGSVGRWIALQVESVSNTTPVELTITGHGMGNYPPMPITSGSGAVVTVSGTPGEYHIASGDAVRIQGTGNGSCDGIWPATVSGSNITAAGASCGGVSGGTVRRMWAFSMFGSSDNDLGAAEPKVWYWEVIDSNTIALLNSTAQGTVAAPGWITWEPDLQGVTMNSYDDGVRRSDITVDRMIALYPFPWRVPAAMVINGFDKTVVQNSWFQQERWRRVDPATNDDEGVPSFGGYQSIQFIAAKDLQIVNNMFYRNSALFVDTGNLGAEDITIDGNTLFNPESTIYRFNNPSPESNGHYYRAGFALELKSCDNCRITGNLFKGSRADFNDNGPTIGLAGVGTSDGVSDTVVEDVEIAYNTIDRSSGGIMIVANDQGAHRVRRVTKRIWIHDNLLSRFSTRYSGSGTGGQGLYLWEGAVDVIWDHNTYHVESGGTPFALQCGGRGQGHQNTNGLYVATEGSTFPGGGVKQIGGGTAVPTPSEFDGGAAFDECFVRGTTPDPLSSFTGHVIIPGIESSSSGDPSAKAASTDTADTVCVHEALASSVFAGLTGGLTFVGNTNNPCNESFNTRLNAAFAPGTFTPNATYSGKGADIELLQENQHQYGPVTVTAGTNQATIAWTAPDTEACTVDLTHTTLDFSVPSNITRQAYSGTPSKSQSIVFDSLTPGAQYAYRISCKQPALRGLLTTGS